MLTTISLTVVFFLIAMAAMAVGVAISGRRLAGSCGGTAGDACRCSPAKRAACVDRASAENGGHKTAPGDARTSAMAGWEDDDAPLPIDPLARPGEDRLIQLSRR